MGKGVESWLLPAAGIGALALTGGAAAPALAGAAGAGTTAGGLGLAGNALAAQGAAGLLGGAGAAAAGYGALGTGLGAGLGTAAATEAAAALPEGMASFGPNGEYIGSTIANDGMTANSFTGGFDAMNPLERFGQRLGGLDFNGNGLKVAQKGLGMMQGQGQPQPQAPAGAIQPMQRPQQQAGSFVESSNISPLELEELKKRQWLQGLGNPNA